MAEKKPRALDDLSDEEAERFAGVILRHAWITTLYHWTAEPERWCGAARPYGSSRLKEFCGPLRKTKRAAERDIQRLLAKHMADGK